MELVNDFFCLFLGLLNKMRTLDESKVSRMREGGASKILLCYPRGSGTLHQSFRKQGGVFSARELFISD